MKSLFGALTQTKALNPVGPRGGGGWQSVVREPFTGAWQRNMELNRDTILSQATVFACITLIAGDVAKLPWGLRQRKGKIWEPTSNTAYDPVLRKPNAYQNSQQLRESWLLSKLINGNTYVLKGRDNAGRVNRLWVLNPQCVQPLVSELGDVYYRLNKDPLSDQYQDEAVVPASEVIHDRFNCLFHPLIGIAPLYAAARLAGHSLTVQDSSDKFFANGARPSGVLVAPGAISEANAKELKEYWQTNFSGENSGRVAVLGDGLQYTAMTMKSTDAQLIEQLRWDDEQIAKVFHVPGYKVGIGDAPPYGNFQSVNLDYYSTCLQPLMEAIEWCLQDGLSLAEALEVHIDTTELLRMDSAAQMELVTKGIQGRVLTTNEGREEFNRAPVEGGNKVFAQMQDIPLDQIGQQPAPVAETPPAPEPEPVQEDPDEQKALLDLFRKHIESPL